MLKRKTIKKILFDENCKRILSILYRRYIEKPKILSIKETDIKLQTAALFLKKIGLLRESVSKTGKGYSLTPLGQKISYHIGSWKNGLKAERLMESLSIDIGKRLCILDVGSGSGSFIASIASKVPGNLCIGVDIDTDAMLLGEVFQEMDETKKFRHCFFIRADAHALPFRKDTFDIVASNGSLQYFDVKSAISEMARVGRNSAALYFASIHAPGFYINRIINNTSAIKDNLFAIVNGLILKLLNRQITIRTRSGSTVRECAIMPEILRRILVKHSIYLQEYKVSKRKFGMPLFIEITAKRA